MRSSIPSQTRLALAALVALAVITASCSRDSSRPTSPAARGTLADASDRALATAIAAEARVADRLLAIPGVVGVGAGVGGGPQVVVYLERAGVGGIPVSTAGVPVRTVVSGAFRPFSLTGSYRPVPIGVSTGNANACLPGTIACVLTIGSHNYFLSANHVFARQDSAAIGEAIVQPALPDLDPACGTAPPSAVIGSLADFEPVVYDGKTPNAMDAAIAREMTNESCATPSGFYGFPASTPAVASPGLAIQKLGRTTELTHGMVKSVDTKVKITFPAGTAVFVHQIITGPAFGSFGDSGALAVTDDGVDSPVGMVIGGSNNGSAILTPIGVILNRFGAQICSR